MSEVSALMVIAIVAGLVVTVAACEVVSAVLPVLIVLLVPAHQRGDLTALLTASGAGRTGRLSALAATVLTGYHGATAGRPTWPDPAATGWRTGPDAVTTRPATGADPVATSSAGGPCPTSAGVAGDRRVAGGLTAEVAAHRWLTADTELPARWQPQGGRNGHRTVAEHVTR